MKDDIRPVGRPATATSRTAMAPWRLQPRAIDRVRFYSNLSGYSAGDIYAESLSERGVQAAIARLREGSAP
jgi:hypothetical protein